MNVEYSMTYFYLIFSSNVFSKNNDFLKMEWAPLEHTELTGVNRRHSEARGPFMKDVMEQSLMIYDPWAIPGPPPMRKEW